MLYETISKDIVTAMKSHDKDSLSTLRLLKSAIDLYLINNKMDRGQASDEVVIDVVSKQVKTHKESIEEFKKGNRQDLIDKTQQEIDILMNYLPKQLSEEEVTEVIDEIFKEVNPTSQKDMGKIMQLANAKLKGKTDMKNVSTTIRTKLENL